jgi:hypothetical protein
MPGRFAMDVFVGAFIFFVGLFFGSILVVGLVALVRVRHGRRDRLQMKRHLQRIGVPGSGATAN